MEVEGAMKAEALARSLKIGGMFLAATRVAFPWFRPSPKTSKFKQHNQRKLRSILQRWLCLGF